ncbi:MAG: hypothetical protein ACPLZY_01600 [Candidatus Norongarragalinales archaeon]
MPLFTFYAFIGMKGAKIPIQTIDHFPNDWQELRDLLVEVARKTFNEYGTIEAQYTFEKHVSTRIKVWKPRVGSYILKPFSHKRNFEAFIHMAYKQLTDDIEIKQVIFAPQHTNMAEEYRAIEKGVKYRISAIIPQTFKSFLENPKAVLEELSAIRYPDYSKAPRLKYDRQTSKRNLTHVRTYLPWGEKIREAT